MRPIPTRTTVVLGPLDFSPLHFVAPATFTGLGAMIGLGACLAAFSRPPSVMGILCGLAFAVMLVGIAVRWVVVALGRGRRVQVVITPSSVEAEGSAPAPRAHHEDVRLVKIRGGRGSYPVWAIDYGNAMVATRLGSWMSFRGPDELERFAAALRHALASTPR